MSDDDLRELLAVKEFWCQDPKECFRRGWHTELRFLTIENVRKRLAL